MQTVASLGEAGVIARAARYFRGHGFPPVVVGIGDDAAVLPAMRRGYTLFASDMLVEGVHFRLGPASAPGRVTPQAAGWKALACNVSDIAAMGGLPRYAVVSLGAPPATPASVTDGIAQGLARCARRFGVAVVGGDTVRAPQIVIDVAILGAVGQGKAVLRRGARVGDRIWVTGRLGGSLRSGRHARFVPRVEVAQWLVRHGPVHAMMDLSDGLASDAWQLARAGGVTLRLQAGAIPVAPAARTVRHALMDGEDFELLFTVAPAVSRRLPSLVEGVRLTEIGRVVGRPAGVEMIDERGRVEPLVPAGFRHF